MEKLPDLCILDYSMPEMNGIEVLQKLEQFGDDYKVLLLTQNLDEDIIDQAFRFGARGFLHKNCNANELKFCIENILQFGYSNITEILKRIKNFGQKQEIIADNNIQLSDREKHFLNLVCDERELTYDQIASEMNVSVKSVDVYRNALFEKFNVKSKVGLVLYSFQHKITAPFC